MPSVHGCHIPFIGPGYVLVSGRRPACSPSWCSLGIALSVQRSFLVEGSWTCEVWLNFVRHRGGGLLSCRKFFCSAVWVGSHLAESFPVGAWVGASFLADRDFLLEVLLVHATGLESSISRLSDWMGVASFTSSAAKAFAVCVVMWGAQVVELATLCGCCQPAATSSRESRFLPLSVGLVRSQPSLAVEGLTHFPYQQWYNLFRGVCCLHTSNRDPSYLVWGR